jgi:hypothetical protein
MGVQVMRFISMRNAARVMVLGALGIFVGNDVYTGRNNRKYVVVVVLISIL